MSWLHKTVLKLAAIAIVLSTTMSFRAVAVEQLRAPILIPNIQEPEEMRVAPFPTRVSTLTDGLLEEAMQAALAKMLSGSPYEAISDFTEAIKIEGRELSPTELENRPRTLPFLGPRRRRKRRGTLPCPGTNSRLAAAVLATRTRRVSWLAHRPLLEGGWL
jgi:hypothetical protein